MYRYIYKDAHLDLKPLINRNVTTPLASSFSAHEVEFTPREDQA